MFDQSVFGEKLKNHRKAKNMTQEEVADKIGVSAQAVSKWKKGECLPDCYNLKQLGDLYGVSLDILLETGDNGSIASVTAKIKELATEYVWAGYKEVREGEHKELGDDLWEMWKAVYFVEIGDRELQERDMQRGKTRINGPYGAKVWDDNGVACVVKSSLKDQLSAVEEKDSAVIATLSSWEYFMLLRHLDCHEMAVKEDLLAKTGYDAPKLNEMLIYLTENNIIEYHHALNNKKAGFKLTGSRGIIVYMLLAAQYLLTAKPYTVSEYLLA